MINYFDYTQMLRQANMWNAPRVLDHWSNHWVGILAEMSEYTNRSYDDGTATLQKLMASRSIEDVIQIQTSYARRAYDNHMQLMTQIGGMASRITTRPWTGDRSQVSIMSSSGEANGAARP